MNKLFLLAIFLFCLAPILCLSQEVIVRDAKTNLPINQAQISDSLNQVRAYTNPKGKVSVSRFTGDSTIYVSKEGYESESVALNLIKSQKTIEVFLKKAPLSLNETVISVSKWQQLNSEVPNRILKINRQTLEEQNPQTTADLLASEGGVFIQKSQLGGGSPMIRGFAANRLLIAVDGIRMNNAIFRSGNLQNIIAVDANAVEQTEVLFGPGSLIYGSDAIGGVMNFYTLNPKLTNEKKKDVTANALLRYSTANEEKTGHADFNIFGRDFSSLTSITYSSFNDLKMGQHGPDECLRNFFVTRENNTDVVRDNPDPRLQSFTGYDQINLMQKFLYQPSNNWFLTYATHYSRTSDVPRYDRLIQTRNGLPRVAEWNYGPQTWLLNHLKLNHVTPTLLYDQASLNVAHQFFEESRVTRDFQDTNQNAQIENVNVWTFNLDMTRSFNEKNLLFYGAEVVLNTVNSEAKDRNIQTQEVTAAPTRYPDGSTWNSYAAYAMHEYKPSSKWTYQGGLRFNYVRSQSHFTNAFFDFPFDEANISTGAFNGNLGVVYKPKKNQEIRAIFSTGFRAPNIDDIGKVFDSEPGSVVVPNPNLVYEYAYNGELGYGKLFGKDFRLDVTGYYTHLTDALIRRDFQLNGQDSILYAGELSRVQAIQNASSAFVYGFNVAMEARILDHWMLKGTASFQRGEEETETGTHLPLRHVSPFFGNVSLRYENKKLTALAYAQFNGSISNNRLAPSQQNNAHLFAVDSNGNPFSPSWYTLNLKSTYRLNNYVSLQAGWENITNQRYRTYSSGIAAAGSNLILSVRAQL